MKVRPDLTPSQNGVSLQINPSKPHKKSQEQAISSARMLDA
jgi:hypothetical protein